MPKKMERREKVHACVLSPWRITRNNGGMETQRRRIEESDVLDLVGPRIGMSDAAVGIGPCDVSEHE